MENQVILSVRLDSTATEQGLAKLVLDIQATKLAQAELTKARDADKISADEYAKGVVDLRLKLKNQQSDQTLLTNTLVNYRKAMSSAAGSTDELKAKSGLLTSQYNALSEAERTGSEAGRILSAELKKTNDALIAAGKNVSDGRRGVGLYGESLKEAGIGAKDFQGGLQAAADKGLAPFQSLIDKGSGLFGKYKSGADLVKTGLSSLKGAGEEGAQGFKAVAAGIALSGLGVFLLLLSSVLSYFTSTNEGAKLLKQGMAALGAVVTTVGNVFFETGKGLTKVFTSPREALDSLLTFLKGQVVNRLAAFGVLIDGIRNRDFKKIADSVIQFNLGITNGTDKINTYAHAIGNVATNAAELEKQQQKLKKSRAELEISEVAEKGRVEQLIRLSKDRTVSADERLNKLREAGRLEGELSAKSLDQTSKELALLQQRNKARGLSITSDEIQEERDKRREYNATVAERNNTLATSKARQSKFVLEERNELLADQKTRATAAQTARQDAVKQAITTQEQLLLTTVKGGAAELAVKQRLLQLAADLEITGAKKTAAEKNLIQAKADVEIQKLAVDFNAKQLEIAKKRTAEQNAEAKREYEEAVKLLGNYLDEKRAEVERDQAAERIGENEAQRRLNAIDAAGLDAQQVINRDYQQENGKAIKSAAGLEIREAKRVADEKKKIEDTKQQIVQDSLEAATNASDLVIRTLGEETAAGQAALAIKKILALAEIEINLEKQLSANQEAGAKISAEAPPFTVPLGIAYTVATDALAITTAAGAAAKILGFRDGGVLVGPRHEQGGIPFTVAGRAGFEAEGGEVILTRGVWQNELLRPFASYLNVLGGGTPLIPRTHMALGGIAAPLMREGLRGNPNPINYELLAQATAKALRQSPPVTRWVDYKLAEGRAAFTDGLANS